jgi:hypothetical protein
MADTVGCSADPATNATTRARAIHGRVAGGDRQADGVGAAERLAGIRSAIPFGRRQILRRVLGAEVAEIDHSVGR